MLKNEMPLPLLGTFQGELVNRLRRLFVPTATAAAPDLRAFKPRLVCKAPTTGERTGVFDCGRSIGDSSVLIQAFDDKSLKPNATGEVLLKVSGNLSKRAIVATSMPNLKFSYVGVSSSAYVEVKVLESKCWSQSVEVKVLK